MSGHSKWSTIKHRKASQDAKRGKVFTKLIKELTIASRLGGSDMDANPRLRTAVANAKSQSMPKENIERAIKKGAGELDGVIYEEIIYEGYAPHNVAIIVEVMTDNRNRTIASVRHAFSKCNGNLGSTNSVQYMFNRIGSISINKKEVDEDSLTELVLDAEAEDILTHNLNEFQVITKPVNLDSVRSYLEGNNIKMLSAEVIWSAQNRIEIDDKKKAEQVIKLIDILEEDDDVNNVFSNFDISDKIMAELG